MKISNSQVGLDCDIRDLASSQCAPSTADNKWMSIQSMFLRFDLIFDAYIRLLSIYHFV